MKYRLADDDQILSIMFGVSPRTVGNIIKAWGHFMFHQYKELDIWLPRELIQEHFPKDFKKMFPDTVVTLDATEFKISKPSNVIHQRATWSTYKVRYSKG